MLRVKSQSTGHLPAQFTRYTPLITERDNIEQNVINSGQHSGPL